MPAVTPSRFLVQAGWNDVPHLTPETKEELGRSIHPYQKKARSEGVPSLGSGAIYPIDFDEIAVQPFAIPRYWPRGYALDVGWNRTAALWGARNPDTGALYLYSEHYRAHEKPLVHAEAIKARGEWIKGCVDPAARGRNQRDGERLMEQYQGHGLDLIVANNSVESGLIRVWQEIATSKLYVFSNLLNFKAEYSMYRRDENGKIVKKFDHLMDCLRYLVNTWDDVATIHIPQSSGPMGSTRSDRKAGY